MPAHPSAFCGSREPGPPQPRRPHICVRDRVSYFVIPGASAEFHVKPLVGAVSLCTSGEFSAQTLLIEDVLLDRLELLERLLAAAAVADGAARGRAEDV